MAADGSIYRHVTIENQLPGFIPLLHHLLETSSSKASVEEASLCHPGVYYLFRTEGSFCGYLNIMMLFSWLRDVGRWPIAVCNREDGGLVEEDQR